MKRTLIFLLLFSTTSFAQDSIFLNKGDSTPFSGFLLPNEKLTEFRNNQIDLSLKTKMVDNLNLQIVDYDKRVNTLQQVNDKLTERMQKSETSFFEKSGFFILGAVLTALIAKGVYETSR